MISWDEQEMKRGWLAFTEALAQAGRVGKDKDKGKNQELYWRWTREQGMLTGRYWLTIVSIAEDSMKSLSRIKAAFSE